MSTAQGVASRPAVDTAAAAIMLSLTMAWGTNQVAIKLANAGFNPIVLTCARSALASVLIFAWCLWRRIPLWQRDGTLWPGILLGAIFGAEFLFLFVGIDHTTAARATLMLNTMPFWVLVGAHFLLGERMAPRHVLGLVLAFGGVALVFADKLGLPDASSLKGDLLCLAGGALWGANTLVVKRSVLARARAEKLLLYQLVVSAAVALPFIPLAGPLLRSVSALALGAFLFQTVFTVCFTYMVWFWLMQRYPAAGLASFTFLTPVFGVLFSALLLGEPLTLNVVAALVLIGTGIAVVNRPART